jgi:hypothetical protein
MSKDKGKNEAPKPTEKPRPIRTTTPTDVWDVRGTVLGGKKS